jgi:hypothetical protein
MGRAKRGRALARNHCWRQLGVSRGREGADLDGEDVDGGARHRFVGGGGGGERFGVGGARGQDEAVEEACEAHVGMATSTLTIKGRLLALKSEHEIAIYNNSGRHGLEESKADSRSATRSV